MIRIFRTFIPTSFLVLGIIELILIILSPWLSGYTILVFRGTSADIGIYSRLSEEYLAHIILYAVVLFVFLIVMGLYWKHRTDSQLVDFFIRLTGAFVLALMMLTLIYYTFPDMSLKPFGLALSLVYAYTGICVVRFFYYRYSDHEQLKRRVLVIGAGKRAQMIDMLKRKSDTQGIKIVGYVPIINEKTVITGGKLLTNITSLRDFVLQNDIEEIVVAVGDRRKSFPVDEILECKFEGIDVVESSDFMERQLKKIRLDSLHPSAMIFSDGFSKVVANKHTKRTFDVIVSLVLLILTSPIMLLTALSIWLESGFRGSILYRQERVGKDGVHFPVIKFRSMREDAETDGSPQWARQNDDRVTKNGKIIRALRIDELPQLYNILRGDMSFVGPRPERPHFVEQLASVIPFYNLRHTVKPGLTGWAQISYPYGASEQDAIEKLQYDLYYMKHYSLLFDLTILLQTAQAVLWGRLAR